MKVIPETCYVH